MFTKINRPSRRRAVSGRYVVLKERNRERERDQNQRQAGFVDVTTLPYDLKDRD
jgi:hypothetical protein